MHIISTHDLIDKVYVEKQGSLLVKETHLSINFVAFVSFHEVKALCVALVDAYK